jgi:signal transduction histidine kinase
MDLVPDILQATFPGCFISFKDCPNGTIELRGNKIVPLADFHDYLWEDVATIEHAIQHYNHLPSLHQNDEETIRAIAVKLSSSPSKHIVVESWKMKHIFDDIDAAFVHSVALVVCNTLQAARLAAAMDAKQRFLRGISHELRTPIHAILSTCELLLEEARAQNQVLASDNFVEPATRTADYAERLTQAMLTLSVIDASGQNLLATVNNLLNFDRLETFHPALELTSLAGIEQLVVEQAAAAASECRSDAVIVCDYQLPPDVHLLKTDHDLLKQCLGAILQNAVEATPTGAVTFTTSLTDEDGPTLVYDVVDTGMGIAPADHKRLFLPFEKANVSTRGPGLGLTVAARIAQALGGALTLVRSAPGAGAHFRVKLPVPVLACQADHVLQALRRTRIPRTYHVPARGGLETVRLTYTARMLESAGLTAAGPEHSAIMLAEAASNLKPGDADSPEAVLGAVLPRQIVLYVVRTNEEAAHVSRVAGALGMQQRVVICHAPIHQARLYQALQDALDAAMELDLQDQWAFLENGMARSAQEEPPDPRREQNKLHILIVDDNKTNLDILCMYSKRRKHAYVRAMDGLQAVNAFKAYAHCEGSGSGDATTAPVNFVLVNVQRCTC